MRTAMSANMVLLAVACVVALAAAPVAATNCNFYTSCANCVCQSTWYQVNEPCQEGVCVWNTMSNRCEEAASAGNSSSIVKQLFKFPIGNNNNNGNNDDNDDQRNNEALQEIENGDMNCPALRGGGTVATIIIMLSLSGIFIVFMLWDQIRNYKSRGQDLGWLRRSLHNHIPNTDVVQWQAMSKPRPSVTGCGYFWMYFTVLSMLLIPSVVWLGVGIPYEIQAQWTFGFFFPIYFVGGFGIMSALIIVCVLAADKGTQASAYALTDKRAVIVIGSLKSGPDAPDGRRVVSVLVDKISSVTNVGGTVSFVTNSSTSGGGHTFQTTQQRNRAAGPVITTPNGTTIRFSGLTDTGSIFMLLQARASGERIAPAAMAVPVPIDAEDAPVSSVPYNSKYGSAGEALLP